MNGQMLEIWRKKGIQNIPLDYHLDPCGWHSASYANQLHNCFLDNLDNFKINKTLLVDYRANVNCICWFGEDFAKFNGDVPEKEEEWLSVTKPKQINKLNAICGTSVMAHFSFYTQRDELEKTTILDRYFNEVKKRRLKHK